MAPRAAKTPVPAKVDLKRDRKAQYSARAGKLTLVTVGATRMLAIDGRGHPMEGTGYADAIGALYGVAYGLKFARKRAKQLPDFAMMPLECLWWVAGGKPMTAKTKLKDWRWTLLMAVPGFITAKALTAMQHQVAEGTPLAAKIELRTLNEGKCGQMLHVGPYEKLGEGYAALFAAVKEQGLKLRGLHHEIYLNDPSRAAPAKLRTILRYPVA